jgi:hypothetical protein
VPEPAGLSPAAPSPDPAAVAGFVAARERVRRAIAEACARSGRDPATVTLVAVGKTVDPARLRAALAAGLTVIGENRVQEAQEKAPAVPGAHWHLVGPLQANKARRAVAIFDVIESVDSVALAVRLDRISGELRPGRPLPILVQVNVDADPAKAGFTPDDLAAALPVLRRLANLELGGLMTVGRVVARAEEARSTFRALRMLSERLRGPAPDVADPGEPAVAPSPRGLGPALSMGMSGDYPVAVEEGATLVRVGRAIFGERAGAAPEGSEAGLAAGGAEAGPAPGPARPVVTRRA